MFAKQKQYYLTLLKMENETEDTIQSDLKFNVLQNVRSGRIKDIGNMRDYLIEYSSIHEYRLTAIMDLAKKMKLI